jgi:hypothetical protein
MPGWCETFVVVILVIVSVASSVNGGRCPARSANCMNARNFARCKRLVRNGCKKLRIQESCPLRFSCGDSSPVDPAPSPTPPVPAPPSAVWDPCPPRSDQCMTDALLVQCQALAKAGCKSIIALLSCPYAGFGCVQDLPPPTCPGPRDSCMNDERYAQCQDLIKRGCKKILTLESCPLQFSCGD